MSKKDNVRDIEAALKRAAEAAKSGSRDARSGKFLVGSRLASGSKLADRSSVNKK
jgi:hypothetical protein